MFRKLAGFFSAQVKNKCSVDAKMGTIRMSKVQGLGDKFNDLLFKDGDKKKGLVVFFGGDVQNFADQMALHRDHKHHLEWSLESVAEKLADYFDNHSVVVIKPSRLERATFSCYDNFVDGNESGAPTHVKSASVEALDQLWHLLNSLDANLNRSFVQEPKIIIGFSKGVVVLNQLVFEMAAIKSKKHGPDCSEERLQRLTKLCDTFEVMSWLDGGHNGGRDTWVTNGNGDTLKSLSSWPRLKVDVRVTPYQVNDSRRPWIGKEENRFSSHLQQFMGHQRFTRRMYYEEDVPSLENHFRVIDTFRDDKIVL